MTLRFASRPLAVARRGDFRPLARVALLALVWLAALTSPAAAVYECWKVPDSASAAFPVQAKLFSADLQVVMNAIMQTGVLYSAGACLVQAQASPDMTTRITTGCTVYQHGVSATVATGNMTHSAAHATLNRIDLVSADNTGAKIVTTGTAAASPLPPTIPQSGGFDNIVLAEVYVPAADAAINANQISDRRGCIPNPTAGSGASAAEPYITKTATAGLSNEFALGSLATGLLINTTTTGIPTIYAGSGTCTAGDFITGLDASGVKTCGTPASGGAGTGLSYLTKVAEGTLSNEFALGSLATGLLINTTTTGVPTILAAQACTNQFVRSYTASGAATCSTVSLALDVNNTLPVTNGGTGLTVGTSGGILAFNSTTTLVSSGLLAANLPVIGGGAGVAPTTGTRSGNTTAFVTTTGTQTSGDCVKIDANGNHIANGSACGGGSSPTTVLALTSDATTNSTTTGVEITGLNQTTTTGTFTFQYFIRHQSAATSTGVKFGINHTGTATVFMAQMRFQGLTGAPTASTQASTSGTPVAISGAAARAFSTTAPNMGPTISVDTTGDMLTVIDGLIIVTGTGDLELWHASEVAAASTVMTGSSLILTKTN